MNFEALLKKKREAELLRGQMERNALRSFEQDFLIEYTHNSTAIEGNTLTLLPVSYTHLGIFYTARARIFSHRVNSAGMGMKAV